MGKINFVAGQVLLSAVFIFFSAHAYGSSFSCPYGKKAACLNYGDSACPSDAKCVSRDAVCFDSRTCGYDGFVCKSEYEDLGDEYDDLLDDCKELAHEHDDIIDKYNKLLNRYKNRESEYEEVELCVRYATTLEEVKGCFNAG